MFERHHEKLLPRGLFLSRLLLHAAIAPNFHRFLHRFHLEGNEDVAQRRRFR